MLTMRASCLRPFMARIGWALTRGSASLHPGLSPVAPSALSALESLRRRTLPTGWELAGATLLVGSCLRPFRARIGWALTRGSASLHPGLSPVAPSALSALQSLRRRTLPSGGILGVYFADWRLHAPFH